MHIICDVLIELHTCVHHYIIYIELRWDYVAYNDIFFADQPSPGQTFPCSGKHLQYKILSNLITIQASHPSA